MPTKPIKPIVPPPALRSDIDNFYLHREANVAFQGPLVDYMDLAVDYVDERASEALAAAIAGGTLPSFSGQAGKILGMNSGGTALAFWNKVEVGEGAGATGDLLTVGGVGLGGEAPLATDLNLLLRGGLWSANTATANRPPGALEGIVLVGARGTSGNDLVQEYVENSGGSRVWVRSRTGGTWRGWRVIGPHLLAQVPITTTPTVIDLPLDLVSYDKIKLDIRGLRGAASGSLQMLLSTDSGATFVTGYSYSGVSSYPDANYTDLMRAANNATDINLTLGHTVSASAGFDGVRGEVSILRSGRDAVDFWTTMTSSGNNYHRSTGSGSPVSGTPTPNMARLRWSGGAAFAAAGSIKVEGMA